jgi:hypothetical protein
LRARATHVQRLPVGSAGDLPGSLEDLGQLIARAREAGQTRLEVTGLVDLSRFALFLDRPRCLQAAERALALCDTLDDDILAALVRGSHASLYIYLECWRDDRAALCHQAVAVTADSRDPAMSLRSLLIEGTINCVSGDYQPSYVAMARVKAMAHAVGDLFLFVLGNVMEAFGLMHLGALDQARDKTVAVLTVPERDSNVLASVLSRSTLGLLHAEAQDYAGALRLCESNQHSLLETNPFIFFFRRIVLAKAYIGLRDFSSAWLHLADVAARAEREHDFIDYPCRAEFYRSLAEYWLRER